MVELTRTIELSQYYILLENKMGLYLDRLALDLDVAVTPVPAQFGGFSKAR